MKKLFVLVSMAISLCGYSQTGKQSTVIPKPGKAPEVPGEVLTNDSTYWTISTLSNIGYVNTTPGAYYNSYKSGGGMIVKFKFKKNNRFEFQLYVQANTYGTDTEAWTQVEGSVEFTTDAKGQPVLITRADKGTYRTVKNGRTTSRPIPEAELRGQHSCTYLWEKTTFGDDPNHIYLLMVDMEAHPGADINTPGSIDPSWVSKFHIPKK